MTDLIILTGFLGSGKTTTLKNIIKTIPKRNKVAIIINEFASFSVDGKIIENDNYSVKEVSGGCVCCSLAKDTEQQIKELKHADIIILETSGVAQLPPLLKLAKKTEVKLKSIVTLVDAHKFQDQDFGTITKEQIKLASLIVVNKSDLITKEKCQKILERIKKTSKEKIKTTSYGKINFKHLGSAKLNYTGTVNSKHLKGISSYSHTTRGSINREDFGQIFRSSKKIHRAKGFINTSEKTLLFNYAHGLLNYEKAKKRKSSNVVFIGEINSWDKIILCLKMTKATSKSKFRIKEFLINTLDIAKTAK